MKLYLPRRNRSGVIALHEPASENFPKGRRIDRVHCSTEQLLRIAGKPTEAPDEDDTSNGNTSVLPYP